MNFGHQLWPYGPQDFKSDSKFCILTSSYCIFVEKTFSRPNINQPRVKLISVKFKGKVYFEWFGTYAQRNYYIVAKAVTHLVPNSFGPQTHLVPRDKWPQFIWSSKTLGPQDNWSPWTNGPHHIWSPWTSGPQMYPPLLTFKHLYLK